MAVGANDNPKNRVSVNITEKAATKKVAELPVPSELNVRILTNSNSNSKQKLLMEEYTYITYRLPNSRSL